MIPQVITFFIIGTGLYKFYYPEAFFRTAMTISYTTIYLFSRLQIAVNKWRKKYLSVILNRVSNPNTETPIEFIKAKNVIYKCSRASAALFKTKVDFLIDTHDIHKKIHYTLPPVFEPIVPSNVKFILTEIAFCGKSIKIQLSTEQYNYAVVGNRLNSAFFLYFLRKHYSSACAMNDFNHLHEIQDNLYTIQIMDHNVNMITLKSTESIMFLLDSYIIEKEDELKVPYIFVDPKED